ncbi:putative Ulp1 protease family catalytic domain, papain-like cysteine peptidase superfamily [Helianthus debilis subsp. tardiflorus]
MKKFSDHLKKRKDCGRIFQLNFLVMFFSVMGEMMLSNTVNQRFLLSLDGDIDVKELNWCDYIVDCLKRTRLMWKGDADFFNGPMLLLSMFYMFEKQRIVKKDKWIITSDVLAKIDYTMLSEFEMNYLVSEKSKTVEQSKESLKQKVVPPKPKEADNEGSLKVVIKKRKVIPPKPQEADNEGRKKVKKMKVSGPVHDVPNLGRNALSNQSETAGDPRVDVETEPVEVENETVEVETEEMRAELIDKELMVFEAHAKKIESLLEKYRKDFKDSELMQAKRRKFAHLLCKYHTLESWVGNKRVGDIVLWTQTKKHKDNKESTMKKKNTTESKKVPTTKKEKTIKSLKVSSLRDEISEKVKETVAVDEVMAVEKQAADFEVEQNKKTSENVDVAQEKALTEAAHVEEDQNKKTSENVDVEKTVTIHQDKAHTEGLEDNLRKEVENVEAETPITIHEEVARTEDLEDNLRKEVENVEAETPITIHEEVARTEDLEDNLRKEVENVEAETPITIHEEVARTEGIEENNQKNEENSNKFAIVLTPYHVSGSEMLEWSQAEKDAINKTTKPNTQKKISYSDFEPPSFELIISQPTPPTPTAETVKKVDETVKKADVVKNDKQDTMKATEDIMQVVADLKMLPVEEQGYITPAKHIVHFVEPITSVKPQQNIRKNPERDINPAEALCSPYIQRAVIMAEKQTKAEIAVSNYIFCGKEDIWDVLFFVKDVVSVPRVILESLCPEVELHVSLIDAWSHILNIAEKKRKKGTDYRLFCYPLMIQKDTYEREEDVIIDEFTKNMNDVLKKEKLKSIKDFDIVFVPIFHHDKKHFYLMCFDLKRTKTTLLDNIAPLEDEEKGDHDPYHGWTRKTKQAFEGYLERILHPKAANMKATSINRLQMPWRTYFNGVDCGIFLMRHMETYMGEDANKYHCGFAKEESGLQKKQIEDLRRKYTTKILLHDANENKPYVVSLVSNFQELPAKEKQKLKRGGFKRILSRLLHEVD